MKHVPSPLRAEVPRLAADATDAEFDAWMEALPPAPGIKHIDEDDEDEDEDFSDVDAAIAAGRAYPHEIVGEWLKTWGRPNQKPFEEWLADQDG